MTGVLVLWTEIPGGKEHPVASFDSIDDLKAVKRYLEETNPLAKYWKMPMVHIARVSENGQ